MANPQFEAELAEDARQHNAEAKERSRWALPLLALCGLITAIGGWYVFALLERLMEKILFRA